MAHGAITILLSMYNFYPQNFFVASTQHELVYDVMIFHRWPTRD